jgi:hypothetical protein
MKIPRGNPRTKQVESSIKLATFVVTKVTLVRIILKLKLSFIKLSMIIYLIWDPRMTLALSRWLVHLMIVLMTFGYQNTYWLTLKDPTRLGYQNLFDQVILASYAQQEDRIIAILLSAWTIMQILIQCNLKGKINAYPCTWIQLMSLYLVLLQSKKSYSKLPKIHSFMPYDAFNSSFIEKSVLPW